MKTSVLALVALLLALVPATARSATYEVQLCTDPAAPGFAARNDNAALLTTTATCPAEPNDPFSGIFVGVKPGPTRIPEETSASWTVTAPAGTSFEALEVRRRLYKEDRDYEIAIRTADGNTADGCFKGIRCADQVGTQTYELTRSVTFLVRCADTSCANSIQSSRAWITLEQVRATIDDPTPPTITPLASSGTWQKSPTVMIEATDASGIASLALRNGGQTVGTTALSCDFRHLQPCPTPGAATVSATDLPDGTHALTAVATDAAGQSATAAVTLKLDRTAPAAPGNVAVRPSGTGTYIYTWTNPDQGQTAPIVAAHLSDGTIVKGANIQQVESASPTERIYLEDEAGNADPVTAAGVRLATPLPFSPPILHDAAAPRIKLSSAKRSGTRLIVRGSVSNATKAKVTATVTRGKKSVRKSVSLSKGRFTIRVALNASMRRKGTVTLTVKHGSAKATKRIRF